MYSAVHSEIKNSFTGPIRVESLPDYIKREHSGSLHVFALAQGTTVGQVRVWIKKGFVVVDGNLFSLRRKLNRVFL